MIVPGDAPAEYDSTYASRPIRVLLLVQQRPYQTKVSSSKNDKSDGDSMSCSGTATPTMKRHSSRGSSVSSSQGGSFLHVASHGSRGQEFGEVQMEPLCLRKGEAASHSFDMENALLLLATEVALLLRCRTPNDYGHRRSN